MRTIFACLRLTGSSSVLTAIAAVGMTAHQGSPLAECSASRAVAPALKMPRSICGTVCSANTSAWLACSKLPSPGVLDSLLLLWYCLNTEVPMRRQGLCRKISSQIMFTLSIMPYTCHRPVNAPCAGTPSDTCVTQVHQGSCWQANVLSCIASVC